MELKKRLKKAMLHSRGMTEMILSEINESEDWVKRAAPRSNHALWIAGHIAKAEHFFTGLIDPSACGELPDFANLFGKGSAVSDNFNDYPSPEEVLQWMKDERKQFFKVIDNCTEEDFVREVKDGPEFMFDVAAVIQMSVWHESLHCGQLTVIHRLLGKSPLADRSKK